MAVRSPGFGTFCENRESFARQIQELDRLVRERWGKQHSDDDLVNWASLMISAWVHPDLKPPVLGLLPTKLFPSIANDGGANKEGRDAGRKNSHCTTSVFTAYEIIVLEL